MKGKHNLEDGSSFANAADTSTLFHPTKERPKFARRSLRERKSGRKHQRQRSNSTGEIVPTIASLSVHNTSFETKPDNDGLYKNRKKDRKAPPPPVSPKPKRKVVFENFNVNTQEDGKPNNPPVKSPKPAKKCEESRDIKKSSREQSSSQSKLSSQKAIADYQETGKAVTKKPIEKRTKSVINEKTSAFLKGISKFGDSTKRHIKHKKFSNDENTTLIDSDENTNQLVETTTSSKTEKWNATSKTKKVIENKEQSDSQTPNQSKVEKRKTSSIKLTLASPFKRGEKVKGTSATGVKYTKKTSPVNDRKALVESIDNNENMRDMEVDGDHKSPRKGRLEKSVVDSEEQLTASPVKKKSNLNSDEENGTADWWKSDELRNASSDYKHDGGSGEYNLKHHLERDNGMLNASTLSTDDSSFQHDTKSSSQIVASPETPKSLFEATHKDTTRLLKADENNNNGSRNDFKEDQFVQNGCAPQNRPLLQYQNLSFDGTYTQPTVRKSYSIVTYTPKPARRKIDENGRIMTKKNCAQSNVLRSLSVSLKYENKAKNSRGNEKELHNDYESKRRNTFAGKCETTKKNFSSWARSSLRNTTRKEDEKNLINASYGTEDSDEDILLNDKLQQNTIQ